MLRKCLPGMLVLFAVLTLAGTARAEFIVYGTIKSIDVEQKVMVVIDEDKKEVSFVCDGSTKKMVMLDLKKDKCELSYFKPEMYVRVAWTKGRKDEKEKKFAEKIFHRMSNDKDKDDEKSKEPEKNKEPEKKN